MQAVPTPRYKSFYHNMQGIPIPGRSNREPDATGSMTFAAHTSVALDAARIIVPLDKTAINPVDATNPLKTAPLGCDQSRRFVNKSNPRLIHSSRALWSLVLCIGLYASTTEAQDQHRPRRYAQQAGSAKQAQRTQQDKHSQNKALQGAIDKALARRRNPQVWKSNRSDLSKTKTLVIGSPMSHVKQYVGNRNRLSNGNSPHIIYRGVPNALKTRINLRAQQRGEKVESRAFVAARNSGKSMEASQRYARTVARLTAKQYRESRYLKHNLAFIRWAANKRKHPNFSIVDIGMGPTAKRPSPFLSGERGEIRSLVLGRRFEKFRVDYSTGPPHQRAWPPAKK